MTDDGWAGEIGAAVGDDARVAAGNDVDEIVASGGKRGCVPELRGGQAAEHSADVLAHWLIERHVRGTGRTGRSSPAD